MVDYRAATSAANIHKYMKNVEILTYKHKLNIESKHKYDNMKIQ